MNHIKKSIFVIACILLFAPQSSYAANQVVFSDDFSSYPITSYDPALGQSNCTGYGDGDTFGQWTVEYTGFGCVNVEEVAGNKALRTTPQVSTTSGETHAPMVVGPSFTGDLTYEVRTMTQQQLRQNDPANTWEVSWAVWNHTDDEHFYYFIPKPNGWELGKADPAYPGNQRFLATGSTPVYPINNWMDVRIVQTGATIQVYVDNVLLTTFTDNERPYTSGKIGLYNEDASTFFDNVVVTQDVPEPPAPEPTPVDTPPTTPSTPVAPPQPTLANTGDSIMQYVFGASAVTLLGTVACVYVIIRKR